MLWFLLALIDCWPTWTGLALLVLFWWAAGRLAGTAVDLF
jgi:hypothetical protein